MGIALARPGQGGIRTSPPNYIKSQLRRKTRRQAYMLMLRGNTRWLLLLILARSLKHAMREVTQVPLAMTNRMMPFRSRPSEVPLAPIGDLPEGMR